MLRILAILALLTACGEPQYTAEQYLARGIQMTHAANLEQARKDYDKAIEADPNLEEAYRRRAALSLGRGLASKKREDFVQAIEDLSKAIDLKNYNPSAYYYRAEAFKEVGQFQDALADFDMACSMRNSLACARAAQLRSTSGKS